MAAMPTAKSRKIRVVARTAGLGIALYAVAALSPSMLVTACSTNRNSLI
jgi:hypothetical protein